MSTTCENSEPSKFENSSKTENVIEPIVDKKDRLPSDSFVRLENLGDNDKGTSKPKLV